MPKRNSKPHREGSADPNVMAYRTVDVITESDNTPENNLSLISRVMSEMGKKGGRIGGKRRLETMSAEERSAAALKAARARWKRKRH